jgi:hypothetical protein
VLAGIKPEAAYHASFSVSRVRRRRRSIALREHCYVESAQLVQALHARGQYLVTAPLHPVATATSVRVRHGKRLVTDGPFAETRQQLSGFFLINAKDLAEVIDIAARIPGARVGTVKIRPVTGGTGLQEK